MIFPVWLDQSLALPRQSHLLTTGIILTSSWRLYASQILCSYFRGIRNQNFTPYTPYTFSGLDLDVSLLRQKKAAIMEGIKKIWLGQSGLASRKREDKNISGMHFRREVKIHPKGKLSFFRNLLWSAPWGAFSSRLIWIVLRTSFSIIYSMRDTPEY